MGPEQWAVALSTCLFVGVLISLEVGFRIGRRNYQKHGAMAHEGSGVIDAAVFGLLGLLLGFAFAGGMSRLDTRRQLIVQEANAIGTAYLRLDLLPAADQPELRRLFREYLERRLRAYEQLPDRGAAEREFERASQMQHEIWSRAVGSSRSVSRPEIALLLLPSLNEMIDVTTSRSIALYTHLPPLIFAVLVLISLFTGLLAGYAMGKRQRRSSLHVVLFAAVIAIVVYTILDLEYPRHGLIRLDSADKALIKLRDSIK
jgi:hypothetical protein